jgi:hypothetical protein
MIREHEWRTVELAGACPSILEMPDVEPWPEPLDGVAISQTTSR